MSEDGKGGAGAAPPTGDVETDSRDHEISSTRGAETASAAPDRLANSSPLLADDDDEGGQEGDCNTGDESNHGIPLDAAALASLALANAATAATAATGTTSDGASGVGGASTVDPSASVFGLRSLADDLVPSARAIAAMRETCTMQRAALRSLEAANDALQRFGETSEMLLPAIADAFGTHAHALAELRRQIQRLEGRVAKARARAVALAVRRGLDPDAIAPPRVDD